MREAPAQRQAPAALLQKQRLLPSQGRRDANLVGFIDVGVHAVLDHFFYQQGVGLIADLSKWEKKASEGLRGPT